MQRLVRDDGGVIVLAFNDLVDAACDKIRHAQVAGQRRVGRYAVCRKMVVCSIINTHLGKNKAPNVRNP